MSVTTAVMFEASVMVKLMFSWPAFSAAATGTADASARTTTIMNETFIFIYDLLG